MRRLLRCWRGWRGLREGSRELVWDRKESLNSLGKWSYTRVEIGWHKGEMRFSGP